ncbi:rhomboid family intramembrane serine protease [Treponema pedis]|uniref:Rhomboid family intramembrane serine protease n=1 Tax=Treponema pedis TaxID=409322 RepID=A0A7S7AVW0_9SPIR|nr:rhomboid family intramembrane serine protease [Treponema pedis]QOW60049.1 rhomboid family intramembrane serine protease [Treponema pedis]
MNILRKPFKYTYKNTVSLIIGINAAVFLLTSVFFNFQLYLGLIPLYIIKYDMYWQFLTYQFVHENFFHLLFNMIALVFFGIPVERKMGSKEFLLYYLLIGTLCGILSFLVYISLGIYNINLIGASGAVFGILLLYAVLFPSSVIYLWGVLPIPAPLLILGYAVIEVISIFSANDGVAHLTHFIGLFAGWLYILIRFGINPFKIWNSINR